jgi:hypothetical protein
MGRLASGVIGFVALSLLWTGICLAGIIYIKPDGTSDAATIQAGVDAAANGDTLLLASGTFRGAGNRNIVVTKSALVIQSETGNAADCIIDCEGDVSWGRRGFHLTGNYTRLKGITITNGAANEGGAIICECPSTIVNCVFAANSAHWGGAMYVIDGAFDAIVRNCSFTGNSVLGRGGAVYIYGVWVEAVFDNCDFRDNHAGQNGGGIYGYMHEARAVVRNSIFQGNSAGTSGGAVCMDYMGSTFDGCTFFGNSAPEGSAFADYVGSWTEIFRSIIAYNHGGSGLYSDQWSDYWPPALSCLDIYGNEGGDWVGSIAGFLGQNGNFSAPPGFCYWETAPYDLRLCSGSLCLPGNHPDGADCGLIGAFGQGCECGPTGTEPATWGAIKAMYK